GEGRRDPGGDAAGHGAAGRGRARAAREGDQRGGRVPGLGAAEGRSARDRGPSDRAPAPLSPDAARARRVAVDDDRLPGADRADQAVPRARRRLGPKLSGELRRDPLSGRLVVFAPARGRRPGAARGTIPPPTPEELEECPFCAGHEERTPPETLRLPEADEWTVRVVPNLYRALERQEVVIHTPRHVRSLAELEEHEIDLVAEAWRRRREDVPGGYVHAFVNEGRDAGASLPHSHSQLAWLAEPPPAVAA